MGFGNIGLWCRVDACHDHAWFGVWGLEVRVQGVGFRVQGLGLSVEGLGPSVEDLGIRISG